MFASILRGFAVLALCFAAVAYAIPQLRISDGISTITIADGGVGDSNASAGVVTWAGSIGVWTTNVDDGITKPALGYVDHPMLDLSFTNISSGAGTLTLMFTETDFNTGRHFGNFGLGHARLDLAGTTAGSVSYSAYGGAFGPSQNIAFDTTRLLGTIGPLTGSFSTTFSTGQHVPVGPFSLTEVITVTHSRAGLTSGHALLEVPESGTSFLLFGIGLVSLGLLSRFRRPSF